MLITLIWIVFWCLKNHVMPVCLYYRILVLWWGDKVAIGFQRHTGFGGHSLLQDIFAC